MRPLITKKF